MLTRSGGPPTRGLLLVTALLAVVGAALLGLGLTGPPPTPTDALTQVQEGGAVEVGDDGFSLWSTDPRAFETAVCTADATPLLRPVEGYSITVAGTAYHEVARSPRALLSGTYPVTCTPEQELYAGPHAERTAPSVLRGPVGVMAGVALLAVALVTGLVALLLHRRQKKLEAFRVPAHRLDPGLRRQDEEEPGPEDDPAGERTRARRNGRR